jgi:hypothetical protein
VGEFGDTTLTAFVGGHGVGNRSLRNCSFPLFHWLLAGRGQCSFQYLKLMLQGGRYHESMMTYLWGQ